MEEKQVFYLAGRWWWVGLFGLMFLFGMGLLASLIVQRPDGSIAFAIGWLGFTALLGWGASSARVEIDEGSILFELILSITVDFAEIEVLTEERLLSFWWSHGLGPWLSPFATLTMAFFPLGSVLVLERRRSSGLISRHANRWIVFRVEDKEKFLSTLEAAGVPVRRRNAPVEST